MVGIGWGQWLVLVGMIVVTNVCSLAVIFSVTSWLSDRRRQKMIAPTLQKLEESLQTDIDFADLVMRLDLDDDDNDF